MENLSIQTSQNVNLNYRMASFGERILAYLIDASIQYFTMIILVLTLKKVSVLTNPAIMLIALPIIFYHLIFEYFFKGQSPGKMALKIKVISDNGAKLTFGQYLIRWVFRLIEIAFSMGIIAISLIIANPKGKRLGDIMAKTILISTKKRIKFDESVFVDVPNNYQITYSNAGSLELHHIKTLLDVMKFYVEKPGNKKAILMVYTAKNNLEQRLNIKTDQKPVDFIKNVIKDFNAINKNTETT